MAIFSNVDKLIYFKTFEQIRAENEKFTFYFQEVISRDPLLSDPYEVRTFFS
jgi:hypothetical protein